MYIIDFVARGYGAERVIGQVHLLVFRKMGLQQSKIRSIKIIFVTENEFKASQRRFIIGIFRDLKSIIEASKEYNIDLYFNKKLGNSQVIAGQEDQIIESARFKF